MVASKTPEMDESRYRRLRLGRCPLRGEPVVVYLYLKADTPG